MRRLLLLMAALLAGTLHADEGLSAEDALARFELFNNCRPFRLVVEGLHPTASDIGLTEQAITNAAESRLRSARLYASQSSDEYLYVIVHVAGQAFSVSLAFKKQLFDSHSDLAWFATTWRLSGTGTHGRDSNYILSALAEHLDGFLTEYFRANEEACGGA